MLYFRSMPEMASKFRFQPFARECFDQAPKFWVSRSGAQVEYLAFSSHGDHGAAPLLFLGGAFQRFQSFAKEAEFFSRSRPILLVDLPSQGSNRQLLPGARFEDLAAILGEFIAATGVAPVIPVGLSYGSAIAFLVARDFPSLVDKLILGGATAVMR